MSTIKIKVKNFSTGTNLVVGNVLGHFTIINSQYRYGKDPLLTVECQCKEENRNQITIAKSDLQTKVMLYCNFEDCKYSPANWITINDQNYSLLTGSIIGNFKIIGRAYTGYKSKYNLLLTCIGDCNSLPFEINKDTLLHRSYLDCGDPNCSSQQNRFENESVYNLWCGIKSRLFNSNQKDFNRYDNLILGQKMQLEWVNNFQVFNDYIDTLSPTRKEMRQLFLGEIISLDRINNNLGYIKENLRWATMETQQQNKSNNIKLDIIKAIRWDYEVNNFTSTDLQLKYNCFQQLIWCIINYDTWKNISILTEKTEYLQFGTIDGIKPS